MINSSSAKLRTGKTLTKKTARAGLPTELFSRSVELGARTIAHSKLNLRTLDFAKWSMEMFSSGITEGIRRLIGPHLFEIYDEACRQAPAAIREAIKRLNSDLAKQSGTREKPMRPTKFLRELQYDLKREQKAGRRVATQRLWMEDGDDLEISVYARGEKYYVENDNDRATSGPFATKAKAIAAGKIEKISAATQCVWDYARGVTYVSKYPSYDTIEFYGAIVAYQDWDSGGPGAGAGTVTVYAVGKKYFVWNDTEIAGPMTKRKALDYGQVDKINEATVLIWDSELGITYDREVANATGSSAPKN